MKKYWYESYVGSIYSFDEELDWEDLHCSQCGDTDRYIGYFKTEDEAIKSLNDCSEYY